MRIAGESSNDKHTVKCSGQTAYIFDKNGVEIHRIKGLKYGYWPLIAPNNTLWIKSNIGIMYVYSLSDFSLIKRIKETKYESQDGNHILSLDKSMVIDCINDFFIDSFSVINFYDINTLEKASIKIEGICTGITYHKRLDKYIAQCIIPGDDPIDFLALFDENGIYERRLIDLATSRIPPALFHIQSYDSKSSYEIYYRTGYTSHSYEEILEFSLEELYDRLK